MDYISTFSGYLIGYSDILDGDFSDSDITPEIRRPKKQLHKTDIHTITTSNQHIAFSDVDGVYTKEYDTWIGVYCADCPIIVLMGVNECAVLHSGWRGAKLKIVEKGLSHFSTQRHKIKAYIGPHIRKSSYIVTEEFLEHFEEKYFSKEGEKIYFDITSVIIDTLLEFGLERENITISQIDTYLDTNYYSFRRQNTPYRNEVSVKMIDRT